MRTDRVPPTGVADPALLDLEFADHQQARPPNPPMAVPRAPAPAAPPRTAAATGSPADGPTDQIHPIGPTGPVTATRRLSPAPPRPTRRPANPPPNGPVGQPVRQPQAEPPAPPPRVSAGARPARQHASQQAAGRVTRPSNHAGQPPPPIPEPPDPGPGSGGERLLQCAYGTRERARRFYRDQVLDRLNADMITFVGRMEMAFVSTADAAGECDSTLRAGPPGFLHVLDERRITYPEYRGNGVLASLGNISENPHVGMLMIDFTQDLIGLHINGRARIVEDADLRAECPRLPVEVERGRTPERWVVVHVEEAYVHCRKHIPRMQPVPRERAWGTDDARRKGGDYFGVRARQSTTAP